MTNEFFDDESDLYTRYSGYVQLKFKNKAIMDKSKNGNVDTTLAIQTDEQYDEVDFINPNWRVENVQTYNQNKGETTEESYMIMDLVGSDKYFDKENSTLLSSLDDIEVFIKGENDNKEITSITKELVSGPEYLTEQRDGTEYTYGVKYQIKLSNFKDPEKHNERGYYDWSGWTYLRIKAGNLIDTNGNLSKEQEVLTKNGVVDFIRPDVVETSLTAEEVYNDKISNGVQKTIRFKVYDKYSVQEPTQEEIENIRQKIQVYTDGEITNTTTQLEFINGEFRLIISGMPEGTSGEIKVKIPQDVVFDQYNNGNEEKIITAITDNTKPVIIYESSNLDVDKKTYTMTIRTYDRYYNDENRITRKNIESVIIEGEELKEKIDVSIETDENNDVIIQTLNGENVITGRRYKIIFSNMDQGDGGNYSGVLSLSINAGAVKDKYLNESLETTIISGVYSEDDDPEIVDTVSPILEKSGVRTSGENVILSLIVYDKTGIDKQASQIINSSTNEINMPNIKQTIGETEEEITAQYIANSFKEETDTKGNITKIAFQISIPKVDEDKLDQTGSSTVYVKLPKGLVTDIKGNVNEEIQIPLSTELMNVAGETTPDSSFLGNNAIKRKDVESVQFVYGIPNNAIVEATKWDVSNNQDTSIMAWYTTNRIQSTTGTEITYNVFIGSEFTINANSDSSYLFANIATSKNCSSTTVLRNMYLLRTSRVTNMSHMFENCGANIMMELDLGKNFSVARVTNMENMFYGCGTSTMKVLDLGARFVRIAESNKGMLTNCGGSETKIYVGEAIYEDNNTLRVKENSTTISYTTGTIECKYKTEWSKLESLLIKDNKSLLVTIKATEENYNVAEMNLNASDIKVYVDGVEATSIEVELDEESKIIDDGVAKYSLYLRNFEEEVRQAGKNFKEWSGNIKLVIKKETVFDEYGNGNLENTIMDEQVFQNTTNKMFVDILKPEFTYISNLTKQYKEESRLEVKFEMNDKYYASQNLQLSDLQFSVYNETTYAYEEININEEENSLTAQESDTGVKYTLIVNNLPNGNNGKYIGNSGYVMIQIPEGVVKDTSNNTNMEQVITIGIDSDAESGNAEIVDVVDPEWRIANIEIDPDTLVIKADIIGTDKYFKTSTLTTDNMEVYIAKTKLDSGIEIDEGTDLIEKRNGQNVVYGKKYGLTITGIDANLGKTGYAKIKINAGTLEDQYGNFSQEAELVIGYIDLKDPVIEKVSSSVNKTNKTEQIVFKITDENFKESTLTVDDINVYVDGNLANSINKNLTESEIYENDEDGDSYRAGTLYTLTLSDFSNTNKINSEKSYLDWSGDVSIRIKEEVAQDYAENKNQQATIAGDFVDFVSPNVQYSYLTSNIDRTEETLTINFSIVDKYYTSGTLGLSDLTILIDGEAPDWTKVEKSLRVEDVNITENGETRKIGNAYTIIISKLNQSEKGEDRNTLDYSGVVTVLIPAGKIVDGSGNKNKSETLVIGIDKSNLNGITKYTSSGTSTGTATDQKFSIEGSYDTQSANGWKIIGVTNDGKLMLVASDVVLPEGSDGYQLSGAEGYENADDELNKISALYGQGYGAINARSITLDDINKIIKYSPTETTKTYNASNVRKNEFHYFEDTENRWSVTKMFKSNISKVVKNTFYEYVASSVTSKEYQTIFGNKSYWIANNSNKTEEDMVRYGVFYVNNNTLSAEELYNSLGEKSTSKNGVKPIVIMDEDVKLKGSSDSMWDVVDEKDAYEIIVDLNGTTYADGDSVKTFKLKPGEKWEMTIPEKTNYSVESITVEYGEGTSVLEKDNGNWLITMGTEKSKIVVNWEINKYKVRFNANGGNVIPETISGVTHGTNIILPTATREGHYTFLGWTLDSSAAKVDDGMTGGASYTVYSNQTLYAVWQRNEYTVTFVSSTGFKSTSVTVIDTTGDTSSNVSNYTGTKELPTINALYNMTITNIPSANEKEGYTFVGWSETENSEIADYTTEYKVQASNITLYAAFEPNEHIITFDPKEGIMQENTIIGRYNHTIKLPEATLNGYELLGWSENSEATKPDSGLENENDYLVTKDITLYAVWKRREYTITFVKYKHTIGDTTTVTDDTGDKNSNVANYIGDKTLTKTTISQIGVYTIKALYGMKIVLPTIESETGLDALGWSTDPEATKADNGATTGAEYIVKDDEILYPTFGYVNYKLTINGNGGTINPSSIKQTHTISRNQVKIEGETATVITENNNTVYPGEGITSQSIFSINCYYGDTITLPRINEREGYDRTTKYSTNKLLSINNYSEGELYSVQSSKTLYAVGWSKKNYTITFNTNGGSMANGAEETITKSYNTEITMPAATKTGYNFQGWSLSKDSSAVEYLAGDTYKITNNITVYAVYTTCQYVVTFSAQDGNILNPDTNTTVGSTYSLTVEFGDEITLPTSVTYTGYTFKNWEYAETQYEGGSKYTVTGNTTFQANKTADKYNYIFKFNMTPSNPDECYIIYNGIKIKFNNSNQLSINVEYGSTITLPSATCPGYKFNGWGSTSSATSGISGEYKVDKISNMTFYGTWTREVYTITFDANGGYCTTDKLTGYYGDTITLPEIDDLLGSAGGLISGLVYSTESYSFKGWSTSSTATTGITGSYTIKKSITLYAVRVLENFGKSETMTSWNTGWNESVASYKLDSNKYIKKISGTYQGGVESMWTDRYFKFKIRVQDINNQWKTIFEGGKTDNFGSNYGSRRYGEGDYSATLNGYYKKIVLDVYSSTDGPRHYTGLLMSGTDKNLYGQLFGNLTY